MSKLLRRPQSSLPSVVMGHRSECVSSSLKGNLDPKLILWGTGGYQIKSNHPVN